GSVPFLRGKFPYYGNNIYFPLGCILFDRACDEGIYESELMKLLLSVVRPGTVYFDVGANIGLLSVPVLTSRPGVKVVSIEPSPDTLRFLQRTHSSATRRNEWTIIGAAVGETNGEEVFWCAAGARSAFDGLRD